MVKNIDKTIVKNNDNSANSVNNVNNETNQETPDNSSLDSKHNSEQEQINVPVQIPIKKKRGRPRKYPKEDNTNKIKRKRGRPKGKKNKSTLTKSTSTKIRGRPKHIDSNNIVYSNKKSLKNIENTNVIIHLPLKLEDIQDKKINIFPDYNPILTIPEPWNENTYGVYTPLHNDEKIEKREITENRTTHTELSSSIEPTNLSKLTDSIESTESIESAESIGSTEPTEVNTVRTEKLYSNYNYNLIHKNNWYKKTNDTKTGNYIKDLLEYKKKREKNINIFCKQHNHTSETILSEFNVDTWPTETSIYCWWCCHPFNCVPCSIPEKIIDNTFVVYGIFCSPECCSAYLFNDKNKSDSINIWDKYVLLNLLYKDVYAGKQIEQAYSRELLKIFGGPLSINEFRNNNNKKLYNIIMPKMKSIIPSINQSSLHNSYSSKKYSINTNNNIDIVNKESILLPIKESSELILKRSKPFRKYKTTLEECMNLKLNSK
jgi:hypothetical protein